MLAEPFPPVTLSDEFVVVILLLVSVAGCVATAPVSRVYTKSNIVGRALTNVPVSFLDLALALEEVLRTPPMAREGVIGGGGVIRDDLSGLLLACGAI